MFDLTNTTKGKLPRLPFLVIKDDILGADYDLSIAFVSGKKSHEINLAHRGKDKMTNVLSFTLNKKKGEIILCPSLIKKESLDPEKNFGKNFPNLLLFLVIHGMLHLKGMEHSSRMERAEKIFFEKYQHKHNEKHFNRNRHGHDNHPSSGGRIHQRRKKS
jgi:probable rRNA maturation factor